MALFSLFATMPDMLDWARIELGMLNKQGKRKQAYSVKNLERLLVAILVTRFEEVKLSFRLNAP